MRGERQRLERGGTGERHRSPAEHERIGLVPDVRLPAPVHGVELEQVRVQRGVADGVVEQHERVEQAVGGEVPEQQLADAAESVQGDAGHAVPSDAVSGEG